VDTTTGEKVKNPYLSYLFSEAEVRLDYNSKTYFFVISNISENSSTYINTY
jgi:hypothetical protein